MCGRVKGGGDGGGGVKEFPSSSHCLVRGGSPSIGLLCGLMTDKVLIIKVKEYTIYLNNIPRIARYLMCIRLAIHSFIHSLYLESFTYLIYRAIG